MIHNPTDNMLSLLESYMPPKAEDVGQKLADDFRSRRIELNMTREEVAEKSGVAISNIVRFERKGLVSLTNLINLAIAIGYISEISTIFAAPKYSTMDELLQIRHNAGRKRAHKKLTKNEKS